MRSCRVRPTTPRPQPWAFALSLLLIAALWPALAASAQSPPAAPAGVAATPGSTSVALAWIASSGATSYKVKISSTSGGPYSLAYNAAGTSYTQSGLSTSTTYYFVVSAVNGSGEGSNSAQVSATTGSALLPATPLRVVSSATSLTLGWDAVTGAAGYNVYRGSTAGNTTLYQTGVTGTSWNDTGVTAGTTYYYKLAPVASSGQGTLSNAACGTPGSTKIAAPAGLTAGPDSGSASQVDLTWDAVSGALSYNLWRGTTSSVSLYLTGLTGTSYHDTGLTTGQTYYYYLTAVDTGGEGGHSNEPSATPGSTPLAAPAGLKAIGYSTSVSLYWGTVTGATKYTLYRGTSAGLLTAYQTGLTSASYADTGVTSGTTYYYAVAATSVDGQGAVSSSSPPVSATVGATRLTAPTGFSAAPGNESVSLSWAAESGAASYNLYRATSSGGEGNVPVQTLITGTSYTDAGLTDGTTYYYKLTAVAASGEGTPCAEVHAAPVAPAAPTSLAVTAGDAQALLTWTRSVGATGYNIYRGTSAGGEGSTAVNAAPVTGPAYVDTGLSNSPSMAYYYRVTALFASAPESAKSGEASGTPTSQDGYWTATPPSGSNLPTPTVSGNATSISVSTRTTLLASALVAGTTTSAVNSSSEANCSGTWTFTWNSTTTWPTLYVVQHSQQQLYQASVNPGNTTGIGSAQVSNTGGSTLVSAVYPATGSQVLLGPTTTISFNTSDLTLPVVTIASTAHTAGAMPAPGSTSIPLTGWSETINNITSTQSAYTGAWFHAHFSVPGNIVLTFTVPTSDVTVTSSLSHSTSEGSASATGSVSDSYSGS